MLTCTFIFMAVPIAIPPAPLLCSELLASLHHQRARPPTCAPRAPIVRWPARLWGGRPVPPARPVVFVHPTRFHYSRTLAQTLLGRSLLFKHSTNVSKVFREHDGATGQAGPAPQRLPRQLALCPARQSETWHSLELREWGGARRAQARRRRGVCGRPAQRSHQAPLADQPTGPAALCPLLQRTSTQPPCSQGRCRGVRRD